MSEVSDRHGELHEARVREVAFDGVEAGGEVMAQLARCDDCLTVLARAVEDTALLGAADSPRGRRLGALLDEVLVWRAVLADSGGGDPPAAGGADVGVGVGVGAGEGAKGGRGPR
jgi:hypothetical protein